MGLGVYFSEDIAHILRGVGEGVRLLVAQRGLQDAADAAYVAGYWAALRAVAVSLGISEAVGSPSSGWMPEIAESASVWVAPLAGADMEGGQ